MWGRFVFAGLFLISASIGYPYAGLLINRMLGTNTVAFTDYDGTSKSFVMGPDAPRPAWLPLLPGARVVTATKWLSGPGTEATGGVELLTHASPETVRDFYLRELAAAGFTMRDVNMAAMGLNAPTARLLAIDGVLEGEGGPDGVRIRVNTRSAGGLILASRIVQIDWSRRNAPSPGPGKAAALAR